MICLSAHGSRMSLLVVFEPHLLAAGLPAVLVFSVLFFAACRAGGRCRSTPSRTRSSTHRCRRHSKEAWVVASTPGLAGIATSSCTKESTALQLAKDTDPLVLASCCCKARTVALFHIDRAPLRRSCCRMRSMGATACTPLRPVFVLGTPSRFSLAPSINSKLLFLRWPG